MPDWPIEVWALVVAGGSLLWNFINSIFTACVNHQNKRRTVVLDEFRATVRNPIYSAVDGLDSIITDVRNAPIVSQDAAELRSRIAPLNPLIISQFGQISDALADANTSRFADGQDWLEDFEDAEDEILNLFNRALNPMLSEGVMRTAVALIPDHIRSLRTKIRSRLERQIQRLT
ncbi:hypothetical protein [Hyphococcus sp.]|uniref:hypothetical protein n=1 Tax=Hyphococcus sp. TaxID=2038636 RepID=UPI003CCC40EE